MAVRGTPERVAQSDAATSRTKRLTADQRRASITAAAREVFLRHGFAGARTRQISEMAGINEALLYRHFRSKEEIFEAAIIDPLERRIDELLSFVPVAEGLADAPDARRESVTAVMDTLLGAVEEILPLLGPLLFAEPSRGEVVWRDHIAPATVRFVESVERVSRAWGRPDVDAHLVVTSAVGACVAATFEARIAPRSARDRAQLVTAMADNVLYGMLGRP
jgi:AcrR family transcriptional regulator